MKIIETITRTHYRRQITIEEIRKALHLEPDAQLTFGYIEGTSHQVLNYWLVKEETETKHVYAPGEERCRPEELPK